MPNVINQILERESHIQNLLQKFTNDAPSSSYEDDFDVQYDSYADTQSVVSSYMQGRQTSHFQPQMDWGCYD